MNKADHAGAGLPAGQEQAWVVALSLAAAELHQPGSDRGAIRSACTQGLARLGLTGLLLLPEAGEQFGDDFDFSAVSELAHATGRFVEDLQRVLTGLPAALRQRLTLAGADSLAANQAAQPAFILPLMPARQAQGVLLVAGPGLNEQDLSAVQSYARHLEIALQNVDLLEKDAKPPTLPDDTEKAIRRQAAEIEAIHAIANQITSAQELDELLHIIIAQATRLLNGSAGGFYLCRRESQELYCAVSYQTRADHTGTILKYGEGVAGIVAQTGAPVLISEYQSWPGRAKVYSEDGFGAVLSAPVIWKGEVTGVISVLHYDQTRQFSLADQNLLVLFASQASVAIENARLFAAEHEQIMLFQALQEVGALLTTQLSLDAILESILDIIRRTIYYDSASIQLIDQNGSLYLAAGRGFPDQAQASRAVRESSSFTLQHRWHKKQAIFIPDTHRDPRWLVTQDSEYIRSWVGAPLLYNGNLIGSLNLDSHKVYGYDQAAAERVMAFANQAAIAIENARLFAAEHTALARAEALRNAAQVMGSSLALEEVLDAVLEQLGRVLPHDSGNIMLLVGQKVHIKAWRGYERFSDPKLIDIVEFDATENNTVGQVIISGEPLMIPDVSKNVDWILTPIGTHIRSWLGVPLVVRQQVIGLFSLDRTKARGFDPEEVSLAQSFALHAATAIENARLFQQAATERRHLRLLMDVNREAVASLDPDEILARAIALTSRALNAFVGEAFLYIPQDHNLVIRAVVGRQIASADEVQHALVFPLGVGHAGWAALKREIVFAADVSQDPRWQNLPTLNHDVRSAISAPILHGDELLGVLTVLYDQPNGFSADHLTLIQAICQEVGLAMSNATRYQQVQRRLAEITLIQNLTRTFTQRLDLKVLLDEVAKHLAKELAYDQVEIFFLQGDYLALRAWYGTEPQLAGLHVNRGVIGRVARSARPVLVEDVTLDPDYEACIPGVATELAVPIMQGSQVIGVINIQASQTGKLTQQDLDLMHVLAGQVSIAIENAILYESVRSHADELELKVSQRTAELTGLYQFSQEIGYPLSYDGLLRLVVRHLQASLQADLSMGWLPAGLNRPVILETKRRLSVEALDQLRKDWITALRQYDDKHGAEHEQVQFEIFPGDNFLDIRPAITSLQALLHAPIFAGSRFLGLLVTASETGADFGPEQQRLLDIFSNQVATAYQRLETVLTAQQKHLQNLVQHLPVGTLLYDANFTLLADNPLGREIIADLEAAQDSVSATRLGPYLLNELVARQNDPLPAEITLEGPPRRIFEAQIRPVGDSPSIEGLQWVLMVREVTQERENQARIQGQERLATVGQLAAGIAHDFNNIMAAILVYADLLRSDPQIPPAGQEKLGIIQQQVQRATSLIRQILDFSRRSVMDQSPLDLLPFTKELDKMLARVMPETIRLELTYQPGAFWVKADPARLQQVFLNLALNARDAMPDGGRLHFELSRAHLVAGQPTPVPEMPPGAWVRIVVSDSGAGFTPEARQHLFEPFYTTKPVGQGTGLGLAQVYGIIKQHDGFIDAHSLPGEGATFVIFLPEMAIDHPAQPSYEPGLTYPGNQQNVLVVEDDPATREALRALLEAQNFHVTSSANGLEALDQIEATPGDFALIVSDLVMPGMGGLALFRRLQESRPEIKMLVVTGHPLDDENHRLLEMGKIHWLQKPFNIREFNQALQAILQKK